MHMEGTIKEELYSEAMHLSNLDLGASSNTNNGNHNDHHVDDEDDLWYDDPNELDKEWQRRHDQFHTMGYRNGIIDGKESSAQKGFNAGFVESVHVGYDWGIVKGVISTLASLPRELQEKLIKTEENRIKFQKLHESLQSVSAADALKMFHESLSKRSAEQSEIVEGSSSANDSHDQRSEDSFQNYQNEFESLIRELPAVKLHSDADQTDFSLEQSS